MIEWIQTATIVLIVIGGWYRRKNFELMDDRLRELEVRLFERRRNDNGEGNGL